MATADFTIRDVLEWAKTKPADERYDYVDAERCALCQFLNETGRTKRAVVDPWTWSEMDCDAPYFEARLPAPLNAAVQATGDNREDTVRWTFGELVKRLEALCPETPVTAENWAAIDAYLADIEAVEA